MQMRIKQVISMFDYVDAFLKKLLIISFSMLIFAQLLFVLYPEQQAYFNKSIQYEGVVKEERTEVIETINGK